MDSCDKLETDGYLSVNLFVQYLTKMHPTRAASFPTIMRMVKRGEIDAYLVGKQYRISKASINYYVEKGPKTEEPAIVKATEGIFDVSQPSHGSSGSKRKKRVKDPLPSNAPDFLQTENQSKIPQTRHLTDNYNPLLVDDVDISNRADDFPEDDEL